MAAHPPGPNDFFFGFRTAARMKANVLGTYQWLHREYGDCVSFVTGPYRLHLFFHPDQVKEALVTHSKSLIRLPRVMQTLAQWNGNSLLIAEGKQWIRQRRLVQPAFQPRRLAGYGETMVRTTRELVQRWREQSNKAGEVQIDVDQEMTALTMAIICRTMFNVDVADVSSRISEAVAVLSDVAFHEMQAPIRMPTWLPTSYNKRKRWAMQVLDETVWRFVKQRREEGSDHGDLLSMLLASVDEETGGGGLTDRQVRNELMTLLLAGFDTTAAGLDWLWYCLAAHPEAARRCQEEVDAVLGGDDPKASDLERLPYLTAAIKETLRLYPPAIGVFLRQTTDEFQLGDYRIPKGSLLAFSSYVTHRDARWFEDPERFDPGRFLPPKIDQIYPNAYFPFGMGPRVCVGQAFAMTEMTLVAATLLQSCEIAEQQTLPAPDGEVKMALRPKHPLKLRWKLRHR